MKAILRTAMVAASVAATIATSTPATANAPTAAAFVGEATIGCFGCGVYGPAGNDADLWVTGVVDGGVANLALYGVTAANGDADFTVVEPVGVLCVVSGTASGSVSVSTSTGLKTSDFLWTRVGSTAVVSLPDWHANASAVFKVTSPVGNPCGGPVTAQFAGTVAG